jgi:hypothetical protein
MDESKAITFRPGDTASLLEAAAFVYGISRNEALKLALRALAEREPRIREAAEIAPAEKEPPR